MKANGDFKPPVIQDLEDGTYLYNFNIHSEQIKEEGSSKKQTTWFYDSIRFSFPVNVEEIQDKVDSLGIDHTVEIEE